MASGMTGLQNLSARVAIRPSKMTVQVKNGLNLRGLAQKPVTSWCQRLVSCDKNLCLHYEMPRIHDFGSKSCSSWIHSSQMTRRNLASRWSSNTLAPWTNLVQLFRSGSI
jgi:hypothetical protein